MSDIISRVWPEWHVENMLGQGSYGKVYRAVRSGHGHTSYAAIKVIEIPQDPAEAKDLASSGMDELSVRSYYEQRARSVLGEVALMEALKGAPNVVGVEDYQLVEREDSAGWIVLVRMPLLEPAKDHFDRVGQPDAKEVARLGIDICRALSACHAKGVIHRDVKPENIFWWEYGYLLGDFGIARRLGPDAGSAHTRAGAYPYMAPEIFAGKSYGADVDTYSLGLVMYRYLNGGRAPFLPAEGAFGPSDSERAVALRLTGKPLPTPKNADAALASIVLRATDPDPDKRFDSAAEMGTALEAWLRGEAGSFTPTTAISIPAGAATVVLDREADEENGQRKTDGTTPHEPQAISSVSSAAQGSFGSNGTIRASSPTQGGQPGAGQPNAYASKTTGSWPSGSASGQQPRGSGYGTALTPIPASAPVASCPSPATTPSGNAEGSMTKSSAGKSPTRRAWVVVAIGVAVAIAIAALIFGALLKSSNHSKDNTILSSALESNEDPEAKGDAIEPGGFLIDDDVCTIQTTDISIDDSGDLCVHFTCSNHTDKELEIGGDHGDGHDESWTVNDSNVECIFATSIEAGETIDDFFFIDGKTLPTTNLDDIRSIAGPLRVEEVDTRHYDVSIPDAPEHSKDGFVGSRLIDDDVCTAEVNGTYFDSSGDLHVGFTWTNHTDYELDMYDEGLWAVNGVYAEAIFANDIDPRETRDDDFFIEPDTLPVTDVDEIESIAGTLKVYLLNVHHYDVSL